MKTLGIIKTCGLIVSFSDLAVRCASFKAAGRIEASVEKDYSDEEKTLSEKGRHQKEEVADLDTDGGLVVLVGGEDLGLLCGDRCVLVDDLSHETASSLDTHRQGTHIHQQDLFGLQPTKLLVSFKLNQSSM